MEGNGENKENGKTEKRKNKGKKKKGKKGKQRKKWKQKEKIKISENIRTEDNGRNGSDTVLATPFPKSRCFSRKVCAPPKWHDSPPPLDRHICAIPQFTTDHAMAEESKPSLAQKVKKESPRGVSEGPSRPGPTARFPKGQWST